MPTYYQCKVRHIVGAKFCHKVSSSRNMLHDDVKNQSLKLFHLQIIYAIFSTSSHHCFHFSTCYIGSCLLCLSFFHLQIICTFGLLVTTCSSSHHCCHIYFYLSFSRLQIIFTLGLLVAMCSSSHCRLQFLHQLSTTTASFYQRDGHHQ